MGAKPPLPVTLDQPGATTFGNQPASSATPTRMKPTIATTLRIANQNSNSPKLRTPSRLIAVKAAMNTTATSGTGNAGHTVASRLAAPTASAAITITSCSHHNHPTVAPAVAPIASAAYTENAPLAGLAAAISPSAFITMITSAPATR